MQWIGVATAGIVILWTALPLLRYEQQPGIGLAVRKYVLHKRGALGCDAQRKPASALSNTARAEVDYLLARLARHDPRAGRRAG